MSKKNHTSNNKLRRIRIVYSIFAAITIIGIALYFLNFFTTELPIQPDQTITDNDIALMITDLHSGDNLYHQSHILKSQNDSLYLNAHISRFDVEIIGDSNLYGQYDRNRTAWIWVLQSLRSIFFFIAVLLTLWFLVTFYISLKKGNAFPSKHLTLVTIIGVLIIVMALCGDISTYLERQLALDILEHTEWVPEVHLVLHISQIVTGLVIAFLAELFRAGSEIQKDQELTI
ncbi:MAG: DUF2975 domain-containing protein [Bacteroidales bacterium]|nr:DUF2975 domain-containing protein [Bacteroidales bacterium]